MAFRNVFRFKRRTFITLSTISIGLALLMVGINLINGIDKQATASIINSQTSHLNIFASGYFDKKDELPLSLTLKNPDSITSLLSGLDGIVRTQKRVRFGAGLIKGMDELPCLGIGMEPDRDPEVFNIKQSLVDGKWLEPGDQAILIGKNLARDMDLKVGDDLTLRMISGSLSLNSEENLSWNAVDVRVKGIFDTDNPVVNGQMVFMPLKQAQEGLSMGSDVTEIVVRLKNNSLTPEKQEEIAALLNSRNNDEDVRTWKEMAGVFLEISKGKIRNQAVIIMIILLIAALGIINTMLMAVLERTREIGMFKAMGMKKREIVSLFVIEGGIIGLLGSFIGCTLGTLGSWYFSVYGLTFDIGGHDFEELMATFYPVKNVFYSDLSLKLAVFAFVLGTAISIVASMYPAFKASRLKAVEALRHI